MSDDLEFLVAETFKITPEVAREIGFSFDSQGEEKPEIPRSSGVFYRIKNLGAFFSLNIVSSKNLADDFNAVSEMVGPDLKDEIHFFQTPYYELGEILVQHFAKQRFPLDQQSLCNLGDPGRDWYLIHNTHSLLLSFRTRGDIPSFEITNIGPLGDSVLAKLHLRKLLEGLNSQALVFTSHRSGLEVNLESECPSHSPEFNFFQLFKDMLLGGGKVDEVLSFINSPIDKSDEFYLRELAILSSFWRDIRSHL